MALEVIENGGASRDRTDDLIVANDEGSACIRLQRNNLIFGGSQTGPNRNTNLPRPESLPHNFPHIVSLTLGSHFECNGLL